MDYQSLYFKLLRERECIDGELHHVIPRHDGGTDEDGLVRLNRRNHTLAHYIRYRWLKQPADYVAYRLMLGLKENAMKIPYYRAKHKESVQKTEIWRDRIGAVRRGKTYEELYLDQAEEQKKKRASPGSKNGMYGKYHSPETLEKIRKAKSKGVIKLVDNEGLVAIFQSREDLVRYGVNREVLLNNLDKGYIKKGKWKNYKIESV